MTTFRVHFADGSKVVVTAATPKDAEAKAKGGGGGIVTKIKRVKS